MAVAAARLALVREVLAVVDAGVDPAAAGSGAVILQLGEILDVSLNLAQHGVGIVVFVIPGERAQAGIARPVRGFRLEPAA